MAGAQPITQLGPELVIITAQVIVPHRLIVLQVYGETPITFEDATINRHKSR